MPNPVVHFEVTGTDGPKLREYYGKVFGWTFNVMPEMDYGLVDNGGKGINGGIGTAPAPSSLFYVAVADPQATLDVIEKKGGKTTMPVMEIPGIVTLAQFTDPEGNLVGLVKDEPNMTPPPSDAKPAANPVTWFEVAGKDGAKTREWYSGIFGWQMNVMEEMNYGMVDSENRGIGGGIGGGDKPHAIFYVEVDNPQGFMDKAVASGGKVAMPVMDGGMVTLGTFTDPEGNLVGLFKSNQ